MDLESTPESVASDVNLSVRTACDFWQGRGLNMDADHDDFIKITRKVKGLLNGMIERQSALMRAKRHLRII